jgi:hypothetical protein
MKNMSNRRSFLAYFSSLGLGATLFPNTLWGKIEEQQAASVTKEMLREAAAVAGLSFTDPQIDQMLNDLNRNVARYDALRKVELDNSVAPPLYFNPIVSGTKIDRTKRAFRASAAPKVTRPASLEAIAFWPVTHLSELLRT